ncbi:MAG: undecaprenyl-diphosphate phosphatase [Erysipelotrichaceae bacterium]|nr:undecaprenyl-diphosphate phosphatase [Erysipelotrichaceae bacterium]
MFIIEIIKAIILGIVQGITEWLPISSTGHMIIIDSLLSMKVYADEVINKEFVDMFFVVIQLGSILAVLFLYFNKLNPFSKNKDEKEKVRTIRLWIKVLIASIPAGIVGILFDDYIDTLLYKPIPVAIALIVYGIAFIIIEMKKPQVKIETMGKLTFKTAAFIGMFQMLALIPGTSRSGSTILGSLLLGVSRPLATEFSFFLSIPVMFGASLLKLIKLGISLDMFGISVLLIGMITAFIVSIFAIKELMKYIRKNDFKIFGYYRIIVGIVVILFSIFKVI